MGVFLRFLRLNFTNGTKSRKASHILYLVIFLNEILKYVTFTKIKIQKKGTANLS